MSDSSKQDTGTAQTVDPRLDNRTGDQRPPLEEFPAKPQQIDGPDLLHQKEATAAALEAKDEDDVERKGMFSPGPHGLSDESVRENDEPEFGTEGLKAE